MYNFKNNLNMRRDFTFMRRVSMKLMTLCLVFFASVSSAWAGNTKWGDYYATVSAYPTGAGLVYAEAPTGAVTETEDEMSDLYTDMKTPSESVDVKYMYNSTSTTSYFNAYAVPADGWIVAGFSKAKVVTDENEGDETFVFDDSLYDTSNPAYTGLEAAFSDENQSTALGSFPVTPTAQYYALFTHVKPTIAIGQDSLGTVSISKVCNEIGDDVTLTAVPNESKNATFDYWVNKNTQEKITQNPIEVKNIQECAEYEAHFKSDMAITMEFPEEGGYKLVYFDKGYTMPADVVKESTFDFWGISVSNNLQVTEDKSAYYITPGDLYNYLYPKSPHVLYGKGTMTFVEDSEMSPSSSNELVWSGETGVKVADLSVDKKYYSINLEKLQFELLADDAVIDPNTAYFALPTECYTAYEVEDAPSVIYWYDPTTTGIEQVEAEKAAKACANGVYTLDGKRLNTVPTKGLYIVNGKKIVKLK